MTAGDPDLHLLAQGRRIEPEWRGTVAVFRLELPCGDLRLVSRRTRPSDIGLNADGRMLGFRLVGLTLVQDGRRLALPLDHPELHDGLHAMEPAGARWTNGEATLPARLLAAMTGAAELHVEGYGLAQYRLGSAAGAALFARFESLGDNCEFALVQRAFDTEPMSLLRWASTDAARLVFGLCRRFEGLGDPAHTELAFTGDPPEYRLRDRRYLGMHTWACERLDDPAREAQMRLAGCARLRLLRRKLLADIAAGERIFVFKTTQGSPHPDSFAALHGALRGIGPAPLLCVCRAAHPAQVGTVQAMGDGLYLGHVDQFSRARISFDVWHRICAATAALVDADRQGVR